MKKIIYSIVIALILSVILALIFPAWFLTEDARWTYLNDSARMDIFISGNVKNGRVQAEGANVRITQPKWLSGNNFQGTMVELPVSYRMSSYQIKLTSQADAAGRDATLVIKFLGNILQYKGKKMPARVTFRNLTLNGKLITTEEVVWHDQPFRLQRPFHPSESITLAFDVHKPLNVTDFSFIHALVVFLASLSISLFLPFLRTQSSNAMPHKRIYSVEFFRVFLILCVFLCHLGDKIDTVLKKDIMEFFHTTSWNLWFAVEPFFIIGGFFLYGRIAGGTRLMREQASIGCPPPRITEFTHIGRQAMDTAHARDYFLLPTPCFAGSEKLVGYSFVPFPDKRIWRRMGNCRIRRLVCRCLLSHHLSLYGNIRILARELVGKDMCVCPPLLVYANEPKD